MKKIFVKPISFVLVLFILFGVFIFPASAEGTETSGVIDGQVYSIVNVNSGKAWDVSAGNTADNSDISQYTPTPSSYWQEWRIRYVGDGEYTIEDMHSRKLLTNVNDNAAIYTANGSSSQRFRIVKNSDGTYTFLSKSSNYNKALGIYNSGTLNGDTLVFLNADSSNNQKHRLILSEEYGIIHERVYSFVNVGINKAIDVNAGGTSQGSGVGLYTYYHDTPWQRWKVMYVGNGDYEIVDMHSGLLLSVPGSSASVTNLWIYPRDYTDGQKFRFQRNTDGTVTIFSKSSDYKMALGWNGQVFVQYSEDNSANQKFNIVLPGYVYNIKNVRSGRSLDSTNSGVTDGTMVTQFTTSHDPQQRWLFCYVANGEYKIVNMYNGKILNIYGDSTDENAAACLWSDNGSSGQRFKLIHNGDGSITFLNGATNYQKALSSPGQANGDLIVQQTYNSNDNNQKFYIHDESTAMVPEGKYYLRCSNTLKFMQKDNNGADFTEQHLMDGQFDQMWEFEYNFGGYYRIKNLEENQYLTANANDTNEKKLHLEDKSDSNLQNWKFTIHEYGEVQIRSQYHIDNGNELFVAVGDGNNDIDDATGNGINVEQRTDISRGRWILIRTTGTPLIVQDEETFCWLACAEMMTETDGYNLYSQKEISKKFLASDIATGGDRFETVEACEYYVHNHLYYISFFGVYDEETIRRFIDDGYPIIMGRQRYISDENYGDFSIENGHMSIITGYYYDNVSKIYRYLINDPAEPDGILYMCSYANMLDAQNVIGAGDVEDLWRWECVVVRNIDYAQNITVNPSYVEEGGIGNHS